MIRQEELLIPTPLSIGSFHTFGTNGRWAAKQVPQSHKSGLLPQSKAKRLSDEDVEVWDEDSKEICQKSADAVFHDDYLLNTAFAGNWSGKQKLVWRSLLYLRQLFHAEQTTSADRLGAGQGVWNASRLCEHSFGFGVNYRKRDFLTERILTPAPTFSKARPIQSLPTPPPCENTTGTDIIYSPWQNQRTGASIKRHYRRPSSVATAVLDYLCHENHRLALNYLFNLTGNRRTKH